MDYFHLFWIIVGAMIVANITTWMLIDLLDMYFHGDHDEDCTP